MDTEEIIKKVEVGFKRAAVDALSKDKEGVINKRTMDIEKKLNRGIEKGQYSELKDIGADLKEVACIIAYTEYEVAFVKKVIEKRREFKNDSTNFGKRLKKTRMKILFLKRSGKYDYYHKLPVEERMKKLSKLKKYPEWYLDRAILDLGSYFEAISLPSVSQVEERRQYRLIAKLLYDFDLFKQSFNKAEEKDEEDLIAYERVIKRAESIPAKKWKERLQAEKERLQKFSSSPSSHIKK